MTSCIIAKQFLINEKASPLKGTVQPLHIRQVRSLADRQAVYAFRYSIIVDELGIDIPAADHSKRMIIDPEDQSSRIFAAFRDGNVIGTIRTNILSEGLVEPHSTLLQLGKVEECLPQEISVTGRLLVSPSLRGGPLAIRLCQACYEFGIDQGIQRDYILVKSNLLSMYERLGYRRLQGELFHPEIGPVIGLVLNRSRFFRLKSIPSIPASSPCLFLQAA